MLDAKTTHAYFIGPSSIGLPAKAQYIIYACVFGNLGRKTLEIDYNF